MPGSPTDPDKDAALIEDGATGKVLYARNETLERHPASLTKMMTLYLLFDALKSGKMTMQTPLPVSFHASRQKPTKLNLRVGETIPVDTAIKAIVVLSANDVAVVIAEALGGTEGRFAELMTQKARQLGMKETNYHNASGLPDPLQISTAADLVLLARHLGYDFPQYFPYFALSGFNYRGSWFPTHDNLIGRYQGADGIKTGYTGASGFNLVSSVVRGGNHVIGVVMGGRTAVRRDLEMVRLLDQTFTQIAANPTMVARVNVPWQATAVAQASAPAAAGFSLPQQPLVTQQVAAALPPTPATPQIDDEDAAELMRAPDENFVGLPPSPTWIGRPTEPAVLQQVADGGKHQPRQGAAAARTLGCCRCRCPSRPTSVAAPASRLSGPALGGPGQAVAVARPDTPQSPADRPAPDRRRRRRCAAAAGPQLGLSRSAPSPIRLSPRRNWRPMPNTHRTCWRAPRASWRRSAPPTGKPCTVPVSGFTPSVEARDVCSRLTQRGKTCFATVEER